jgi:hypothetical protein
MVLESICEIVNPLLHVDIVVVCRYGAETSTSRVGVSKARALEHKGQREWNRFLRIPRLRSEGWGRSKIIEKK